MTAMELIVAGLCIVLFIGLVSVAMTVVILFVCDWIKQHREQRIREFVIDMVPYIEDYMVNVTDKTMDKVIEKSETFYNRLMKGEE